MFSQTDQCFNIPSDDREVVLSGTKRKHMA